MHEVSIQQLVDFGVVVMNHIEVAVVRAGLRGISRIVDGKLTFFGCLLIWASVRGMPMKSVTLRCSGEMMLAMSLT